MSARDNNGLLSINKFTYSTKLAHDHYQIIHDRLIRDVGVSDGDSVTVEVYNSNNSGFVKRVYSAAVCMST